MIRDLHPHTRVQRAKSPDAVPREARELGYEPSDASPGFVGRAIAWLFVGLGVIMGGLALFLLAVGPKHAPFSAERAEQRFTSPAPPLEADAARSRDRLERGARLRLHDAPRPIGDAMRDVARRGWGEAAPAPATADIARQHAREDQ